MELDSNDPKSLGRRKRRFLKRSGKTQRRYKSPCGEISKHSKKVESWSCHPKVGARIQRMINAKREIKRNLKIIDSSHNALSIRGSSHNAVDADYDQERKTQKSRNPSCSASSAPVSSVESGTSTVMSYRSGTQV